MLTEQQQQLIRVTQQVFTAGFAHLFGLKYNTTNKNTLSKLNYYYLYLPLGLKRRFTFQLNNSRSKK